jgi:glycosyltransferase involved in cell wall biosynthesis
MLLRDGVPCELCIEGTPYNAVRFACYRGSRSASAAVARMIRTHRRRNTWQTKVDRYIALTNFARTLFVRGGLPADKIATKVNFAPEPASQGTLVASPPYALFLGRLSQEKGVRLLLDSWRRVPFELHVAGDGPLADSVREAASANHRIRYLGRLSRQEVEAEMAGAAFMVFPSVGYESCPSTIIEAFAQATPLLASRLGAAGEIVTNGKTGVHFEAGNPSDLASKAIWLATNVREREAMGRRARREYEHTYSATRNLGMLLGVYADAQAEADRRYGSGAARS